MKTSNLTFEEYSYKCGSNKWVTMMDTYTNYSFLNKSISPLLLSSRLLLLEFSCFSLFLYHLHLFDNRMDRACSCYFFHFLFFSILFLLCCLLFIFIFFILIYLLNKRSNFNRLRVMAFTGQKPARQLSILTFLYIIMHSTLMLTFPILLLIIVSAFFFFLVVLQTYL